MEEPKSEKVNIAGTHLNFKEFKQSKSKRIVIDMSKWK